MPTRRDIFIDNGIYHVFNKTIDYKRIFAEDHIAHEFLERVWFYRPVAKRIRYSVYKECVTDLQELIRVEIEDRSKHSVEIIAYCLMPNHFHFMLKQRKGGSLMQTMSNVLNSFTRYYNTREKRTGPVFLPRFQSRMIVSDEQFIHTTRYIHLNPFSGGVVRTFNDLISYPYSSFAAYVEGRADRLIEKSILANHMSGDMIRYKRFVEDNAEHQRMLEYIKHAEKWS